MKQFEMFVDEKVTTWRRNHVVVDAENEKDAANQILEGNEELLDSEILYEFEEAMTPEDNNGFHTLEIRNDKDEMIYSNSDK
jgi:hypothetical protein